MTINIYCNNHKKTLTINCTLKKIKKTTCKKISRRNFENEFIFGIRQ